MRVKIYCGNCGNLLDSYSEPHDSVEFMFDKSNLKCHNECENFLIKISVERGG